MKLKKLILAGSVAALTAVALTSCKKDDFNGLKVTIASTPDQIDPALNSSVDGGTYDVHLFSGLIKYKPNASGDLELTADLAKSIPTAVAITEGKDAGKVKYTFELRDNIMFSDGTNITAQDFVDSWARASSYELGADYNYMFDIIDYTESNFKTNEEGKQVAGHRDLNVTAKDSKTLEVVLPTDVPYFIEVCAFPALMVLKDAKNSSVIDDDGQWAKSSSAVTSGAYTIKEYKSGVRLIIEKNDNYWDAASVKQESIGFIFISDDNSAYSQYDAGELAFIDSYPLSMQTEIAKRSDYHQIGNLGTYYVCFNVNSNLFAGKTQEQQEKLRHAIALLIDRKDIIDSVVKGGQTPSTGFVGEGLTDAAGGEFVDHNGVNGDGKGYFGDASNYSANKTEALELIAECGYTVTNGKVSGFPSITYLYNNDTDSHQKIGEAIQSELAAVGITFNMEGQQWSQFLQTRKAGNYDVARNGWLADYNDPISFLDLWVTASGNNDCQLGKAGSQNANTFTYEIDLTGIGSYTKLTGTWAETYDVLIGYIKKESDTATRYKLMHKAEDLLMSTGAIASIYNYTDGYLQNANLCDVYASVLGFKYFMYSYDKTAVTTE